MLNRVDVQSTLDLALSTGGDFAELFFEDSENETLSMTGGDVENATYTRTTGVGIRVLLGSSCAYAYTNRVTPAGLLAAARQASELFSNKRTGAAEPLTRSVYTKAPRAKHDAPGAARTALLKRAHSAAKAVSAEISQVVINYLTTSQEILVANSLGVWGEDYRVRTRFTAQAVARSALETQTGHEAPGYSMGFDVFEKHIDVEQTAATAAQTALTMLHAPQCPAAFAPAIIDGGFGGVIFHEACGHSLEATAVAEGNSVFCGRLGQKIASPLVTAVDDGTLAGEWGFIAMDDEGSKSARNLLIKDGVLTGYLVDTLGGRKMNMPQTGSARRENYAFAPTSRMTNTFIAPGSDDEEEIVRSLADGLYAKKMGGGSVNPLTGEFNFAVQEGYWVKNGVIDRPVRGATLIGTGAQVLLDIDRVGKKMWLGAGMCGSVSGSIPTCVGQPMIRVNGITIGGTGTV